MSGFTPINVDSQGRILPSQTSFEDETRYPSKRRKLQTVNPWTPRKPRKRHPRKETDGHELTGHLSQRNGPEATEEDFCETSMGSGVQRFLYAADTAQSAENSNFTSPKVNHGSLLPSSQPSGSLAPEVLIPECISRSENSVATQATDNVLVPATQNQVVPQTPLQRAAPAPDPESSPLYQHSIEGWNGPVDTGRETGDDDEDEADVGVLEMVDWNSAQSADDSAVSLVELRGEHHDGNMWEQVVRPGSLANPQELNDGGRYEVSEIEDALLSAEAAISICKVNQPEDSTFSTFIARSSPLSTPCTAARGEFRAEKFQAGSNEDLLDEFDDQDIYDMIDVADQISTALQIAPPLPDPLALVHKPKLTWNAPRNYKAIKNPPTQSARRLSEKGSFEPPMKIRSTSDIVCDSGCHELNIRQSIVHLAACPHSTEQPLRAEDITIDDKSCAPVAFVRGEFPPSVKETPVITGITSHTSLRVCFRIGELLKLARSPANNSLNLIIELYAKINHSEHYLDELHFTFGDLFYDSKPPFLDSVWREWKNNEYWKTDATALTKGVICRALGKIEKQRLGGKWAMNVFSAQLVCWDDVEHVKGIVCAR